MLQNKYKVRLKNIKPEYAPYKSPDTKHPFKMRFLGKDPYSGSDDNGNRGFSCKELEVVEVSRAKAQQLLKDFPNLWAYVGSTTGEELF